MTKPVRNIVVFDLGGVLIDWDPRYLYCKLFRGDETAMEHFLSTVCTHEWNLAQDAGGSFAEGRACSNESIPRRPNWSTPMAPVLMR
jgi:2-haloacid dehalogenase